MWNQSAWSLIERGGPIMWLLLGISVVAFALILDRLLVFLFNYQRFSSLLHRIRPNAECARWPDVAAKARRNNSYNRIIRAYIRYRNESKSMRDEILQREGNLGLQVLETRLRWLAIVGQSSPMIGLLGTVTGLVSAFHAVELLGGQVQPSHLASGIWEALLTTVFGLIIALPCLVTYSLLEGRVDAIARDLTVLVSYLDEWNIKSRKEEISQSQNPQSSPAHKQELPQQHDHDIPEQQTRAIHQEVRSRLKNDAPNKQNNIAQGKATRR